MWPSAEWFLTFRPAYPWSQGLYGWLALLAVALLLAGLTLWAYVGRPQASPRRLAVLVAIRLLALVVAMITAVRPGVGVQETPNYPSVLLIGVDVSQSMTVRDEVNNQSRIEAVRRVLEKCQGLLDDLAREQNINVQMYAVGASNFDPSTSIYSPTQAADAPQSDYGTYLYRTFERWQSERFIRGHILIGDGADNGQRYSAVTEAARWARRGVPLTTVTVGDESTRSDVRDLVLAGIDCDPAPAAVKTDVTAIGTVHAYGYAGGRIVARAFVDDKPVAADEFVLDGERDNTIRLTFKAPEQPGEVKVRLEIGQERNGRIVPLSGESNAENNASETYLTVTKEGVRVLLIDRLRWESTLLLDALRADKRFDIRWVVRQTADVPATPQQRAFLDLESQSYDVVIIGNVRGEELQQVDPGFLDRLRQKVMRQGLGVMFLGGEHAFYGIPTDWLPIDVVPGSIVENVDAATLRPLERYQFVPTDAGLDRMLRLGKERSETIASWNALNGRRSMARLSGYNRVRRKPTATVYAWATPEIDAVPAGTAMPAGRDPLLVGHQIGDAARGRVLVFAAYDSYLWTAFGQPKSRQGLEIHARFWKQCVLWLAHQDEEEGQAYIRPALRQLKVGAEQTLRIGVKRPDGGDDPDAEMTVKILPLPAGAKEPDAAALATAPPQTILREADGAVVRHRPRTPGEYYVLLTSPKKDANNQPVLDAQGQPVLLQAVARYIVLPELTEEMLRPAADHDFMTRLSVPFGGKALRLEDLPAYLQELKNAPLPITRPKPRYYPDWRRDHSRGFLPAWLVVFVLLLTAEWTLRRLWGMV